MPRMSVNDMALIKRNVARAVDNYRSDSKRRGVHTIDVAKTLGFKKSTFYNRMENIGDFTLDELMRFASVANISMKTLLGLQ